MRREQWMWLPIRLGLAAIVAGGAVMGALWWGAGQEISAETQLPYVLVAGGAGLGLVLLGITLFTTQRRRIDQRRLEDAAAAMLTAAAKLAAARDASRAGEVGPSPSSGPEVRSLGRDGSDGPPPSWETPVG